MSSTVPRYDEYHPDRVIPVWYEGKFARSEVFEPKHPKRDSGMLIGIIHGWLGSGTLRAVAGEVAHQGHTVFTVNHSRWKQEHRSKAVHEATKMAVQTSGMRTVLYIGHSMAARDLIEAATHQQTQEELSYEFRKLVTVDGLGTNDSPVNPLAFLHEINGHGELAKRASRNYVKVVGGSIVNLARNPLAHIIIGAENIFYNGNDAINTLQQNGVEVERHFHDEDGVIRKPRDGSGIIHDGSHLTFAVLPDDAVEIARAA